MVKRDIVDLLTNLFMGLSIEANVLVSRYYGARQERDVHRTVHTAMMDVMVSVLRGLGYSVVPMIVSLIGACGLRLFWIFTFFRMEAFHTITSLYMTYPASWIITGVTHVICFIII